MAARKMVIEVTRPIDVKCFHVLGDFSFAQKREELRAVLLLMQERGGRLTPDDVCQQLLGGRPRVVGERLLGICERLGLVKWTEQRGPRRAELTDLGLTSVRTDAIFVPEFGTWSVWVAQDPLLPKGEALLAVKPFHEPPALDEVNGANGQKAPRVSVGLPPWVKALRGLEHTPRWGDGRALRVVNLEDMGELAEASARLEISFRIAPQERPTVRLAGTLDGQRATAEIAPPQITFEELWSSLPIAPLWRDGALRKPFAELDEEARARFEIAMTFQELRRPALGAFGRFTVEGIPLKPVDARDASRWATWLLEHRATSYVAVDEYARRCEVLRRETFRDFPLELPGQAQLAQDILQRAKTGPKPPAYWHLQAPLDWHLAAGT